MAAVAMGLLSLNAMAQKLTEYVDPFIGTTNFSVCNPGAVLPHGLMSVVPFNVASPMSPSAVWDVPNWAHY